MQDPSAVLEAARDAHRRRDWPAASEAYRAAQALTDLTADDLLALGDAAWWMGRVDEANAAFEAAFKRYRDEDRPRDAAMVAMGIAINHFLRGDEVVGSGWMSRSQRLLGGTDGDTPEHGYAMYVLAVESQFDSVDRVGVIDAARRVQEIGRRHSDASLVAAGMLGEGRMLIKDGRVAEGMTLLDEAMLAVLSGEVTPEWAGNIYCNLMIACHELADHRRAARWTDATERWLDTLPVAVLFRGICRVHRSQLHQLRGAWERAEREALRVCEELEGISIDNVAEGWYQVAESRRLRGSLASAEDAYRAAHRRGRDPQPGLALLRLAQGRVATAAASVEASLASRPEEPLSRAPLLVAQVEIAVAAHDRSTARAAADELASIAATFGSSGLEADAARANGSVEVLEGDAASAVRTLRGALARWQALDAPYEAACVRRQLARAYTALGDHDAAQLERDAAAETLAALGAPLEGWSASPPPGPAGRLSRREVEVLGLVAAGRTNRQVAGELVISEKTVARHLSNIYAKLELPSRTAAAAFAFEHGLVRRVRG
jgi:DNA-binding CsgD family transcriptional regulator